MTESVIESATRAAARGRSLDKCTEDVELPREEAVRNILARCSFKPATEWVALGASFGRVIAQDVRSRNTLPNHLAADRDGVAVYYDRFEDGMPDTSGWREGVDYVFANTGIGIPGDFDTCILIEQVSFDDEGHIRFATPPEHRGFKTIPAGRELNEGDLLARRGDEVTPSLAARLAKGGQTVVPVMRRPVVTFLPTGTELVPPNAELPPRKNADANSTLVLGKLLDAGAQPVVFPISRDDRDLLRERLRQAVDSSDIVIINAGSSKGTDDFAHEVIAEMGEIFNHQVDTGPGKHTMYALVDGVPVVGLSGPTPCCDCTFDWYVRPLIARYFDQPDLVFPQLKARALVGMSTSRTTVTFMLAARAFMDETGRTWVVPMANLKGLDTPSGGSASKGSASETGAGASAGGRLLGGRAADQGANCYVPMAPGFSVEAGDKVAVELRWPFTAPALEPALRHAASKVAFGF